MNRNLFTIFSMKNIKRFIINVCIYTTLIMPLIEMANEKIRLLTMGQ